MLARCEYPRVSERRLVVARCGNRGNGGGRRAVQVQDNDFVLAALEEGRGDIERVLRPSGLPKAAEIVPVHPYQTCFVVSERYGFVAG